MSLGAEVEVVNPGRVKVIAESRRKTDKLDAKLLCELLRMNGLPQARATQEPRVALLRTMPMDSPSKPLRQWYGRVAKRRGKTSRKRRTSRGKGYCQNTHGNWNSP